MQILPSKIGLRYSYARSGRVPMQNASAFCMGPGEGVGDVVVESKFRFFN